MSIIKIQKKGQVTLPTALRERVGVADGDLLEVTVNRGSFILRPKQITDRSTFPTADDEYTPAQRRIIDARLAKARTEIKKGKVSPAFATVEEMTEYLKKRKPQKTIKRLP